MKDKKDGFTHQDWEPVVLKKTAKQLNDINKSKCSTTIISKNNKPQLSKKLLNDDNDDFKINTVTRSLSVQIQQARNLRKMSQKELANKLCTQPSVIQSYENGKAIPDGAFLAKMSKVLGVKLKK